MVNPIHHFHKRKRIYQKYEPYPHPYKWIRFMDRIIYLVGVAGPIMTLPQFTKIWFEKNASGVSLISWVAYLVLSIPWLMYGMLHKEKPIIITYIAWIILDSAIVLGIILYG
jgi:uncharacterized protein with PQ loop repeat